MSKTIYCYSEQPLDDKTAEFIRTVADSITAGLTFETVNESCDKVLVFGRASEELATGDKILIRTYSMAQLLSKANAATILENSLRLYIYGITEVVLETITVDHPAAAKAVFEKYFSKRSLDEPAAIDIETSGNLRTFDTPETVDLLTVAIKAQNQAAVVFVFNYLNYDAMCEVLAEYLPKFTKSVYHNGKFDTRVLNRILGVKLDVWFDTMLAHHVLNQAAGEHGLKVLCQRYFGAEDWEKGLNKYTKGGGHYENIPKELLVEYNAYDVIWTMKLYEFLSAQIEEDANAQKAFMFEMEAAKFLLDVEVAGIPVDYVAVQKLKKSLSDTITATLAGIRFLTRNEEFNPNSPKQVKEWLDREGYPVTTTNEEYLRELLETLGDSDEVVSSFIESLLEFRKAKKALSTYVDGWTKKEIGGRVHPTFLVHGTSTGRLSSSSPNAQNMPRDKEIRSIVGIGEASE